MKAFQKLTLTSFIFLASIVTSWASVPVVSGPASTGQGSTQTYTFNNGTLVSGAYWVATNYISMAGDVVNGTTYSVTITWSSTATSGTIAFWGNGDPGTQIASLNVTLVPCTGILTPTSIVNGSRCGSGAVTLSATAPATNYQVRWYAGSNSIIATGPVSGTSAFTTPSLSTTAVYTVTALLTTNGCESSGVSVTATINTIPTVTASNLTICSGTGGVVLTNNVASTTNTWTVTATNVSGATNGSGISGTNSPYVYAMSTLTATTSTSGTAAYTITPSVNGCTGTAINATATVNPVPTTSNAGSSQNICVNGHATLGANTPSVGTGAWTVASGPSTSTSQFSSTTNPAAVFTPAGGAGTYVLTWTITKAPCVSSSSVTITVSSLPSTSSAGSAQTICSISNATLSANTPTVGTGAWSVVSGPSTSTSQFTSLASPTAKFTPAGGAGTYILRWTITNGVCTPSTSNVTITVTQGPTIAVAGPDQTGATTCGVTSTTLAANTPSVGTGSWSVCTDCGTSTTGYTINDPTSPTTTFTGTAGAAYNLEWKTTYGSCTSVSGVNVTFNIKPDASVPATQTICSGSVATITITNPNHVTGTVFNWTATTQNAGIPATSGTGTSISGVLTNSDGVNASSATYTITPSVGGCYGTSVTATVNIISLPPAPVPAGEEFVYQVGDFPYFEVLVPDGMQAKWYADSNPATTAFNTNPGFLSSTAGSQTYWVSLQNLATGCLTPRLGITSSVGQAPNQVKVTEETIRISGLNSDAGISALTSSQKASTVSYLDGFGRTSQVIAINATPAGNDMVQSVEYDSYGRTSKNYLPYVKSTGGLFQTDYMSKQPAFYQATGDKIADDYYPFAMTNYEQSPLGRPLIIGSVGQAWQPGSHAKRANYSYNNGATSDELEEVRMFHKYVLSLDSFYVANTLSRTQVTDENGNIDITFTDATGKTIVRKQYLNGTINSTAVNYLHTYYIYDDMSRLKYIIPPGGFAAIKSNGYVLSTNIIDQHLHQYVYDNRGRLIQKKTPGQAWTYYVYDRFNRLILTQDGNLRPLSKWAFVKYDNQGRTVMSGLYKNTTQTDQASMQTLVNGKFTTNSLNYEQRATGSGLQGYTNQSFPTIGSDNSTPIEVLNVNYYDNYDFDNNGTADYTYDNAHLAGLPATSVKYTRGLPTGSKKLILGSTNSWIASAVFYDDKGRAIQTQGNHHLNLTYKNKSSVTYDFEGKTVQTKNTHSPDGTNVTTVLQTPNYDVQGRVAKIYHSINGAANQLVAQYEYNELGQAVTKKLHSNDGTSFLQNVDYRYNIRGWLTSINNAQLVNDGNVTNGDTNDYFGMEMNYNTDAGNSNTLYYNGNVSSVKWKGAGATSGTTDQRSYKFNYDKTDKLTAATFQKYGTSAWDKEQNTLNESQAYDHNGNILSLARNQNQRGLSGTTVTSTAQTIDNLTYTYAVPNQLSKVIDAADTVIGFKDHAKQTDYTYDTHGNMTQDLNKDIQTITYNVLGKVQQITFIDGRVINYTYDAGGSKLTMATTVSGVTTTTDYVNGYVYNTVSGTRTLSFFSSPEGRVIKNTSGNYEYQYAIADHQGNTRVVFTSATPTATATTATFEGDGYDQSSQFVNVASIVPYGSANHTTGGSKVVRMNQNNPVGPGKSLSVYPGDKIDMEVWSYYEATSGYGTSNASLTGIITSVAGAFGGVSGGPDVSGMKYNGVNNALTNFGVGANQGDTQPAAFLNYILFDKNYNVMDAGWQVVPSGSFTKQRVSIPTVTVKESGYIFVYLSYEDQSNNYVYFDDFKVTLTPTAVVQSNEYYPFGLQTANSWTRDNSSNNFLYNAGSELNTTSGMYDLPFRNYDAALGRFFQVDPLSHTSHNLTPYHYAGNNPIGANDPSGLMQQYYANPEDDPMYQFVFKQRMTTGQFHGPGGADFEAACDVINGWNRDVQAFSEAYRKSEYDKATAKGSLALIQALIQVCDGKNGKFYNVGNGVFAGWTWESLSEQRNSNSGEQYFASTGDTNSFMQGGHGPNMEGYLNSAGDYPFYTHAYIIRQAFQGILTDQQIKWVIAGSELADTQRFQDAEHSYMHAMLSPGQTRAQGEALLSAYLSENLQDFGDYLKDDYAEGAFMSLGMGMHPLMDMWSPSHREWQTWDPNFWNPVNVVEGAWHIVRESFTLEGVNGAIQSVQNYYNSAILNGH